MNKAVKTRQVLDHWGLKPKPMTLFLTGCTDVKSQVPLLPSALHSLGTYLSMAQLPTTNPHFRAPVPGNQCLFLSPLLKISVAVSLEPLPPHSSFSHLVGLKHGLVLVLSELLYILV